MRSWKTRKYSIGRLNPVYNGRKLDSKWTETREKRGKPGQKRDKLQPVFRQSVNTLKSVKSLVSRSFHRRLNVLWLNRIALVVG